VIDFASGKVLQTWPIPGGGSPDMGNVSADGKYLWLSGRYDDVVYRIETTRERSTRSRSAASRTASRSGRSRPLSRSATPATSAEDAAAAGAR
jgi:streptogramin lyase